MRAGCHEGDRGLVFYQAGQPVLSAADCGQVCFPKQNEVKGRIAIYALSIFPRCLTDFAGADYDCDTVAEPLSYSDLCRGVIEAELAGVLAAYVPCWEPKSVRLKSCVHDRPASSACSESGSLVLETERLQYLLRQMFEDFAALPPISCSGMSCLHARCS
jgi:hypothetical protein